MTAPSAADLPLDRMLAIVGEVAAVHRLESETLALQRCHGRVLAQDVAATAIRQGAMLTPARVALAASLGIPALSVTRRPTVAVFTTGDHLVEPGMPLAAGQAYDGNRELLMGLLRAEGLESMIWPRLPDDRRQVEIALRDAGCAFDLVIVCESSACSAGGFVAETVAEFGAIHFHASGMPFGAQVLFGSLDQARVLGLPDDPFGIVAAWLTLGRALVDGLQGRVEPRRAMQARLARSIGSPDPRRAFLAARVEAGDNGLQVDPQASNDLLGSNALIVMPDAIRPMPAGAIVDVIPL